MIKTARFRLRPIEKSDATDIFQYSRKSNVGPNAGWKSHETVEETYKIVELIFLDTEGVFGIILKNS